MARTGKTTEQKQRITRRIMENVMHTFKEGKLTIGKSDEIVTDRKQAIAIGLSEARANGGVTRAGRARKSAQRRAGKRRSSRESASPTG